MRTPRPSSISISTYCHCTTGAIRSHGWPSSSSKMPSWIAITAKWRSTVWRITYLSRFCLFLIMLPDILLLLVICIPISKWCFYLQTPPLWSNQWTKELQQLLRPTTWGGPLPRLLLQLRKTMNRQCCNSGRITASMSASKTLFGLGVMSPRSVWMASGRIHSRGLAITAKDLPRMRMTLRSSWRRFLRNWLMRSCWNWKRNAQLKKRQEKRKLQKKKKNP